MQTSADWQEIQTGVRKYAHRWLPDGPPLANVCIVHGLGEHGGRYHPLAKDFVKAGFAVTAFDQQGHGESPEVRGRIRTYESLLDDIAVFSQWSRRQFADIPQILFGHSMGGNLVINYGLRDYPQPHRIVASSPMIQQTSPPSPLFVRLARVALWVAPNLTLKSTPVAERLMSDPEEQRLLREDQLFHSQLSLRLGAALLDSGAWMLQNAHRLKTRTLLSHGTSDYMTSPQASTEFAKRAGHQCELVILDGQLHDPFRDINRAVVIERFITFIRDSLSDHRRA